MRFCAQGCILGYAILIPRSSSGPRPHLGQAMQEKKAEKARLEREQYKKMTPEQQRRIDEKEAQKNMKKRAGSMMKVMRG